MRLNDRILVIDDSIDSLTILEELLQEHYTVRCAQRRRGTVDCTGVQAESRAPGCHDAGSQRQRSLRHLPAEARAA